MPRFQIKRKTRQPSPEVVPEEKIDENEMSLESESESSDESEPLTEQMETLNLAPAAQRTPQRQTEPQYAPQRRARDTSLARRPTYPVQSRAVQHSQQLQRPRQLGQTRPVQFPKPSRSANGRPKLQFRSHFGPNGKLMSTQDKARSLYYSCFG